MVVELLQSLLSAKLNGKWRRKNRLLVRMNPTCILNPLAEPSFILMGTPLFGSNDLIALVEAVMQKLIPILNLTPIQTDVDAWRLGYYELKRVYCTAMWELPQRSDVRAWLTSSRVSSKSRHGRPITTGSTPYFGKNSRRWSIKFYSKGNELDAKGHKLPYEIPERDKLIDWANNKLRGELTLRSIQLKETNLKLAANWTESIVIDKLITHIEALDMAEQFSLTSETLDGLPGRLVAVCMLWKDGEDLRRLYPKTVFYRYRAEFLKHGIDINVRQPYKNKECNSTGSSVKARGDFSSSRLGI